MTAQPMSPDGRQPGAPDYLAWAAPSLARSALALASPELGAVISAFLGPGEAEPR